MHPSQSIMTNAKLAEFIYKNKRNLNFEFLNNMLKFGIDLQYTSQDHIRSFLDSASTDIDRYVHMCYDRNKIVSGGKDESRDSKVPNKKFKRDFRKNRR